MRKLVALVLASMLLLSVFSFAAAEEKVTLNIWSFTDELRGMIDKYYKPAHPEVEITYTLYPTDGSEYRNKLDTVIATAPTGSEAPDVFALEAAFVKYYVNSDTTAPLSDLGFTAEDFAKSIPAMVQIGTDSRNGQQKASAWQSTPGALFYRASLAEKYLGVTTPEEFQALVADWDLFMETAVAINDASEGAVKMFNSFGDIWNAFQYNRDAGWVVDGKLNIDPVLYDYLDLLKQSEDDGLYNMGSAWSETWFAGMKSDTTLTYLLPTWGLHYVLKPNCGNYDAATDGKLEGAEGTYGDWRMVDGPVGYSWGGTWLGANSAKVAAADEAKLAAMKEFIRFFTLDEDFLYTYAKDSGDFVSNNTVVDKIIAEGGTPNPFLGGQDHYAAFATAANLADGTIMTEYDDAIYTLWNDNVTTPYMKGEKDLDTAIVDFKAAVAAAFTNIVVE